MIAREMPNCRDKVIPLTRVFRGLLCAVMVLSVSAIANAVSANSRIPFLDLGGRIGVCRGIYISTKTAETMLAECFIDKTPHNHEKFAAGPNFSVDFSRLKSELQKSGAVLRGVHDKICCPQGEIATRREVVRRDDLFNLAFDSTLMRPLASFNGAGSNVVGHFHSGRITQILENDMPQGLWAGIQILDHLEPERGNAGTKLLNGRFLRQPHLFPADARLEDPYTNRRKGDKKRRDQQRALNLLGSCLVILAGIAWGVWGIWHGLHPPERNMTLVDFIPLWVAITGGFFAAVGGLLWFALTLNPMPHSLSSLG